MNNLTDFFYEKNSLTNDYFKEDNQNFFNKNFDYNINELSNNEFSIEIALPGFDKTDIKIEKTKSLITIKKKPEKNKTDKSQLLKAFNLEENIEVKNANIKNGLLTIKLIKLIPEEDKPKLILIN